MRFIRRSAPIGPTVRHEPPLGVGTPFEFQAKPVTHPAVCAVATDHVFGLDRLHRSSRAPDPRHGAGSALLKRQQFPPRRDFATKFDDSLAKDELGLALRDAEPVAEA